MILRSGWAPPVVSGPFMSVALRSICFDVTCASSGYDVERRSFRVSAESDIVHQPPGFERETENNPMARRSSVGRVTTGRIGNSDRPCASAMPSRGGKTTGRRRGPRRSGPRLGAVLSTCHRSRGRAHPGQMAIVLFIADPVLRASYPDPVVVDVLDDGGHGRPCNVPDSAPRTMSPTFTRSGPSRLHEQPSFRKGNLPAPTWPRQR